VNELTFPLLAALATVEDASSQNKQNIVFQHLGKLCKAIDDSLPPIIDSSSYVEKSRMRSSIAQALDDATFLVNYPELLGKTCVGLILADSSAETIINDIAEADARLAVFSEHGHSPWSGHVQAPQLLTNDDKQPRAQIMSLRGGYANFAQIPGHPANLPLSITPDEYRTFLDLKSDGIKPADMLIALAWFTPLKRKQAAYLLLRPEDMANSALDPLLRQCDVILVCGNLDNEKCLEILANNFRMPVFFERVQPKELIDRLFIRENHKAHPSDLLKNQMQILRKSFIGREVDEICFEQLNDFFNFYNCYIERVTTKDRIRSELLALLEKDTQDRNIIIQMNKRLNKLLQTTWNLRPEFEKTLNKLISKNNSYEKDLNNQISSSSSAISSVLELATDFEKAMEDKFKSNSDSWHKPWLNCGDIQPSTVWRRIILRSMEAGDMDTARQYQVKLAAKFPKAAAITKLYMNRKNSVAISKSDIENLRLMPDSQEVFRARIYFRDELGLSKHDCAEIAGLMKRPQSADEKYFYALHLRERYERLKESGNFAGPKQFDELLNAHWDAILAGSEDAADEMAMYCGGERRREDTLQIASTSNPTGLYVAALLSTINGDAKARRTYLNMAAALGHTGALVAVADEVWKIRMDGKQIFKDGILQETDTARISESLAFYKTLQNRPGMAEKIPDLMERLGFYYFCSHDWVESVKAIGDCPKTTDGKFALAIMKRYGLGFVQDRAAAIRLIREAEAGTGPCAIHASNMKEGWRNEDMAKLSS